MIAGFGKRLFAWILKKGDSVNNKIYGSLKQDIFKSVHGTVVEIGPGSGVNFSHLPPHMEWIGIEPNQAFHSTLIEKAIRYHQNARLISGTAADIPLPDAIADFAICTLVLCSVTDPAKALAEIKRVLKPGGKMIFIEHVAAPQHSRLRAFQNFSNPMNRVFADGCNCNRETWTFLESAGFSKLDFTRLTMKGSMLLHKPHIAGTATK
ncbi:MAG TPA: class I SAM-dependent methyltransferase [Cyclobacteriaceae bacterium]|nr:class I SAM-dependent methyltransferase [Cyclobacteriaceae bacterium]